MIRYIIILVKSYVICADFAVVTVSTAVDHLLENGNHQYYLSVRQFVKMSIFLDFFGHCMN